MSDTSTRSGMLWEFERILSELEEKPQILLMENVPQVHSQDNIEDFKKWVLRLEELGYKNYWQDLIATDYGIPQTRNRCFMASILGNYSYSFPPKMELKLRLKDLLEPKVDEKFYLSEAMMKYVTKNYELNSDKEIAVIDSYNKKLTNSNVSGCIVAGQGRNQGSMLMINNATKKGYLEAQVGDGIDISTRMKHHRGTVQKDKIQTITTMGEKHLGVVVDDNKAKRIGTINQWHERGHIYDENNSMSTICATDYKTSKLVNTSGGNTMRIRKLTPLECFRLMGVKDEDFEKIKKNQSNCTLYHLAGDSIVVNVLMAIFKKLF